MAIIIHPPSDRSALNKKTTGSRQGGAPAALPRTITGMNVEDTMRTNIIKHIGLAMIFLSVACLNAHAGDLDDGIKADDKIEAWDTLDHPDINISFIKRSAKASVNHGDNSYYSYSNGDVAIGSFINQPGAEFKGDVTIIFDGEDINAVSE